MNAIEHREIGGKSRKNRFLGLVLAGIFTALFAFAVLTIVLRAH